MIKVGIVDDRIIDLEKLAFILSTIPDIEISFSTTDATVAYNEIQKGEIDLLIADIEMPGISGYELADFIQTQALLITVIFITAKSGYAVHAFELDVHDYIMKPYTKERLMQSLDRLRNKQQAVNLIGRFIIKRKGHIDVIMKRDIIFIERTGRTTSIHTIKGVYEAYLTMNECEASLRENNFIRSHRSFIINLHYVNSFSIYTKRSYRVTFDGTNCKAMVTREQMDYIQKYYF